MSLTSTAVCISYVDTLPDPKAWGLSQEATSLSLWFGWPVGGGGGKGRKCKFQLPVDNVAAPTISPPPTQAGTDMQRWSPWEFKVFRATTGNNLPWRRRSWFDEQHRALPPDPAKGNKIQPARA